MMRIAAIEDADGNRAVLLTADLLKFPRDMAWRTKQWAQAELDIPSAAVVLNLSHTHSAPALFYQPCYPQWALDVEYIRDLEATIRKGIRAAVDDLRPARIRYGLHQAHFGVSRRKPDPDRPGFVTLGIHDDGYYDPDMPVLAFSDPETDALRAVFYAYGCHPTSNTDNVISADWPGVMAKTFAHRFGADVPVLFAQSAGGSVMPRYNRRTDQERAEYADRWAAEADKIADFIQSGDLREIQPAIAVSEREFELPYDKTKYPDDAQLAKWSDPTEPDLGRFVRPANRQITRLWANWVLENQRMGTLADGFRMHTARIRLAPDLQVLTMSGEVTAQVGRMIKDAQTGADTIFLGYCSYTDAYIPTADMLPHEGHEALYSVYFHERPAPFTPDIDNILKREVAKT